MKIVIAATLTLMLASTAWAKKPLNPADYPKTAHINSAIFTHTTAPSNLRVTELQIQNLIYISNEICKGATVGSSFPARVDGKWIYLLVDGKKVCKYRIDGTKEVH